MCVFVGDYVCMYACMVIACLYACLSLINVMSCIMVCTDASMYACLLVPPPVSFMLLTL